MIATLLIGLAAGCASALMFASIISGALISLLLFYLAPLPLMMAALGWGPLSATVGGIAAAIGLGAIFGLPYCIAFALTVAIPAWWLGHLVLLGRSATPDGSLPGPDAPAPVIDWYPIGRTLLWITGFAAVTTAAAMLTLGFDGESIFGALRRGLLRMIAGRNVSSVGGETEQLIDALVAIAPAAAAVVAMVTLTLNLWLAAKITRTSGRLHRPWPDLKSAALPPMTLVALLVAIAFCFSGGLLAILAQIATATLMIAYGLTGFAVLHTLTMAMRSRAVWLSCAYAMVLVFGWPVIAMIGLGLADGLFGIRHRYLQRRPPALPAS
jgi:hypothetical protein